MPKGYWIPHLDVQQHEGLPGLPGHGRRRHKRFGSKLLARGGRREVVEGKLRARNVLREFNSFDEALGLSTMGRTIRPRIRCASRIRSAIS